MATIRDWLFDIITHRIHGTGIFTYIYHKFKPPVGKYTIHGSYGFWRNRFMWLAGCPVSVKFWGSTLVWEKKIPVDVWKIPTGFYGWKNMFLGNPPNIPFPKGILGIQTNEPQTNKVVAGFTYFLNVHPENLGKIFTPFWGSHIFSNWVGEQFDHQLEDTLRKKQKTGEQNTLFDDSGKPCDPCELSVCENSQCRSLAKRSSLEGYGMVRMQKISHMLPISIMLLYV